VEINRVGDYNVEVEIPLIDQHRRTVGSIDMTFPYVAGFDRKLSSGRRKPSGRAGVQIPGWATAVEPPPAEMSGAEASRADRADRGNTQAGMGNEQEVAHDQGGGFGQGAGGGLARGLCRGRQKCRRRRAGELQGQPQRFHVYPRIKLNLFSNYRLNGGLPIAGVICDPNEDKERIEALKGANALMFGVASPGRHHQRSHQAGNRPRCNDLRSGGKPVRTVRRDIRHRFAVFLPDKKLGIAVNASDTHLENGVYGLGGHGDFESVGADLKVNGPLELPGRFRALQQAPSRASRDQPVAGRQRGRSDHGLFPIREIWCRHLGPLYAGHDPTLQGRADFIISENWKVLAKLAARFASFEVHGSHR